MNARICCIVLAVVAGCSSKGDSTTREGQSGRAGDLARVKLTSSSNTVEIMRVVQRLAAPAQAGQWAVQAARARLRPAEPSEEVSGGHAVDLFGGGEKLVRIPGPFDPSQFQRVRVQFRVAGNDHVSVRLRRGGEEVIRSRSLRVRGGDSVQQVVLDVPRTRAETALFDDLLVHFYGTGGRATLYAVELLATPLTAWLPAVKEAFVEIDREDRLAIGLSTSAALEARCEKRRGDRLGFSFGWPETVRTPGQTLRLHVSVRDSSGETLLADFDVPPAWRHESLDLGDLRSGPIDVRFDLRGNPDAPAVCALGGVTLHTPSEGAPVVLLVTSDTHRGDHVGEARRDVAVSTPVLDALARRGVFFEDCFSSSNFTIPSHSALFTALTPRDTGVIDNYGRLSERAATLAEHFRDAGFATMASLSARLLKSGGLDQGFDRFAVPTEVDWYASDALDRLEQWLPEVEGRPVFVWLHLFDAHRPYKPPAPYHNRYWPSGSDPMDPAAPDPDLPEDFLERIAPGLRRTEYLEAQYRAEIDYLDSQLARILDHPRVKDGVIAVTADHGESLGQHGVWWTHEGLYPDTLHVPLILAWPEAPAGTRVPVAVRQVDVGRTLLDLAGLEAIEFPGANLARAAEAQAAGETAESSELRFALSNNAYSASLTAGGWHLILHLRDHHPDGVLEPRASHTLELYDLKTDPGCEREVSATERDRAARMRVRLVDWLVSPTSALLVEGGADDRENLEQIAALGYAQDDAGFDGEYFDPECDCAACEAWR